MTTLPLVRHTGLLFGLLLTLLAKPVALLPQNSRYFEWQGKPTVFVASGEHYGAVINLDFDFGKYLQTMRRSGLNHTRVFAGDYLEVPGAGLY